MDCFNLGFNKLFVFWLNVISINFSYNKLIYLFLELIFFFNLIFLDFLYNEIKYILNKIFKGLWKFFDF